MLPNSLFTFYLTLQLCDSTPVSDYTKWWFTGVRNDKYWVFNIRWSIEWVNISSSEILYHQGGLVISSYDTICKGSAEADVGEFTCSGAETGWTDLTALAVVSVQLFDKDGSAIQVSDPIHISVPLPSDTRNRMATSVPAWLYQPKTGKEARSTTSSDVKCIFYDWGVRFSCECILCFCLNWSICNDGGKHFCRTVGQERDGLHQKGRPTVCLEHCGSSDGILVSCLPFVFRYRTVTHLALRSAVCAVFHL